MMVAVFVQPFSKKTASVAYRFPRSWSVISSKMQSDYNDDDVLVNTELSFGNARMMTLLRKSTADVVVVLVDWGVWIANFVIPHIVCMLLEYASDLDLRFRRFRVAAYVDWVANFFGFSCTVSVRS